MTQPLLDLLLRDLDRLASEIQAYTNPADLWKLSGDVNNSAGNLCLHLCGNLQHFIGAVIGHSGYERNRPFEFSGKDVPVNELHQEIEATKAALQHTLPELSESDLEKPYPINVLGKEHTVQQFLLHLYGHLNYHLGQITYHRRLLN